MRADGAIPAIAGAESLDYIKGYSTRPTLGNTILRSGGRELLPRSLPGPGAGLYVATSSGNILSNINNAVCLARSAAHSVPCLVRKCLMIRMA